MRTKDLTINQELLALIPTDAAKEIVLKPLTPQSNSNHS